MALPYQGYGYNPYQYGQVNPLQPQMDRLAQMQAQYQQPQQVNQGILWVQGEAGAKSYLVAPNTSVLLMDSENSNFYIKLPMPPGCRRSAPLLTKRSQWARKSHRNRRK